MTDATARWRLFVAVPIGEDLRASLAAAVKTWRSRADLSGLRWGDPSGWHVTLHFLGSTDPEDVPGILRRVADVADAHAPMELPTGGLGGFPSRGRARVAWYGVADPDRRLHRLAEDLRSALAPDEPGRFRAHVTLARARSEPIDLGGWIDAAHAPSARLEVGELHVMRSHLGRGPAHYETVATLPLGEPARVRL